MATSTTYLFLVAMVQAFSFHSIPGKSMDPNAYCLNGFMSVPLSTELEIRPRY